MQLILDLDAAYGSGYAASFSTYSGSDPSRHMIEFSVMKNFHQGNVDWFTDYSGIQFTEVSDSASTYGDLRFHLQDFDAWLDLWF